MTLSAYTISKLADIVCGGNGWPYRRGTDLVDLFNEFGFRDCEEPEFVRLGLLENQQVINEFRPATRGGKIGNGETGRKWSAN